MNASKGIAIALAVVAVILVAGFAFYMVDVDQTKEARLPDVKMKVDGGQLPKFNVETGSVSIQSEKVAVPVPEVNIKREKIEVPSGISINPPAPDGPAAKN